MEIYITDQLAALAHPKRLALFRLLMRRYPSSVPAGEIAAALAFKSNTASNYLSALKQVSLITQTRHGTTLRYMANVACLHSLFDDLLTGCCQNRPDICQRGPAASPLIPSINRPVNVLFLCSANSARSIIAEALLTSIGNGKFHAYSAGTSPAASPHPMVLALLSAQGHRVADLTSNSLDVVTAKDVPMMDFVITVCDQAANQECPAWPGHPMTAHWGLADPLSDATSAEDTRRAIERAYDLLKARVQAFSTLPFDRLTPLSLQHHLDDLGQLNTPEKTL